MKKLAGLLLPFAFTSLLGTACVSGDGDDLADADAIAASEADLGEGGKEDAASANARLDRSTPAEVAATFAAQMKDQLDRCFASYQAMFDENATKVNAAVLNKFGTACINSYDVVTATQAILTKLGQASASPAVINAQFASWALPQLKAASINGFVSARKADLMFYLAVYNTQNANAQAREKNPTGVNLKQVRDQWQAVTLDRHLDNAYLNPVQLTKAEVEGSSTVLFRALRRQFPLTGAGYVEAGRAAVRSFQMAHEGPNNAREFEPIATALKKTSIKKQFYFAGGGRNWSTNVLIVIDEHNQAWGFQMGYSE